MKIGTLLKKLGIRFLILFLLFLGVMTIINCSGHRSLRAELERWEQAGLLLEPERGEEQVWREAERAYAALPEAVVEALVEGPHEDGARRREALQASAGARAAIGEAVDQDHPLPDRIPEDAPAQWRTPLAQAWPFATLLDGAARAQAAEADLPASEDTLLTMISLSQRVGRSATLNPYVVRLMIDQLTLDAIHAIFADSRLVPSAELMHALAMLNPAGDYQRMLRGEASRMPEQMLRQQGALITRGWWQHDIRYALEHKRRLVTALDDGAPLRSLSIVSKSNNHPWWARTLPAIAPGLESVRQRALHVETRRNQALLALALREHRREHGSYPDTLTPVLGDDPTATLLDPYTGQAFDYERRGEGFVLTATTADGEAVTWAWDE